MAKYAPGYCEGFNFPAFSERQTLLNVSQILHLSSKALNRLMFGETRRLNVCYCEDTCGGEL